MKGIEVAFSPTHTDVAKMSKETRESFYKMIGLAYKQVSFIQKRIAQQKAYITAVAGSNRQPCRKRELINSATEILKYWEGRLKG